MQIGYMKTPETERIVRIIEKTYNKHPWYGLSIIETLNQVNPEITHRKIGNTHSIIELVLHMISWRTFATKRLSGDNVFEVSDHQNFPTPDTWKDALHQLEQCQKELVEAASRFPEDRLGELVPSKTQKYTYYTLLHGITHHDLYHLGQIAFLIKAFEANP